MRFLKMLLWEIFDIVSFLVFIGGIVLFIRFFIFNPFTVVGSSMMSTIHENDILIVDKVTPKLHWYQRGDIIVFVPTINQNAFVKRIVGLPGETVKLENQEVYICDYQKTDPDHCRKLDEPYLDEGVKTTAMCDITVFDVEPNTFVVLGDNRPGSTDSRCCFGAGCNDDTPYLVPMQNIIGKASLRLLPLQSFTTF